MFFTTRMLFPRWGEGEWRLVRPLVLKSSFPAFFLSSSPNPLILFPLAAWSWPVETDCTGVLLRAVASVEVAPALSAVAIFFLTVFDCSEQLELL